MAADADDGGKRKPYSKRLYLMQSIIQPGSELTDAIVTLVATAAHDGSHTCARDIDIILNNQIN